MKNITLLLFLFAIFFPNAQNLEKKLSTEICNCIGDVDNKANPDEVINECFKTNFAKNYEEISKKIKGKDFEDYYISIEGKLANTCKNFLDYRKKAFIKEEQKSISNCEDLKVGTYYYSILQQREKSYLTFTKNEVVETRKNNIYSKHKIDWVDKCTYKLTLQDGNSAFDNTNYKSKPLTFRIIENKTDYFVVQTEYFENAGLNNVVIYKLPYINNVDN